VELFDPEFDLAILRVQGLAEPALTIDPDTVGRATKAVVLGYPEGGPLAVDPAGVRSELFATGLDIYGENPTVRAVYVTRPTFSPNVYQQMIGRGLRGPLNGGKERCLIVNVDDNWDRFGDQLAFREFEPLWDKE